MDLVEIHRFIATMINVYPLFVAGWGFFNFARRQPPDGGFNGALVIAEALIAVEVLSGVALRLMGHTPGRDIHWLYGLTMLLVLPAIFAFTRGSNSTRESFLYGLGMLFVWGLAERAAETGGSALGG